MILRSISLLLLLPFCFLLSCSEPSQNAGPAPLIVGMEMAYPPFEFRNSDNQPDGISVRLAEDLAAHLGRPVQLKDVAWDGIIPSLTTGKIDLIISSMTRTEERAQTIDFSDGYVTNGLCLLVPKDSPIQSIDDVNAMGAEAKVAVKLATTGHLWAKDNLKDAKLTILDEASSCVVEVSQGKANAFVYDQISIFQHAQAHPDTTRAILKPIREETWAIGIKKGNDTLRNEVNAFLKTYRDEGKFDDLADEYMAEEKAYFEKAGVPFIFH